MDFAVPVFGSFLMDFAVFGSFLMDFAFFESFLMDFAVFGSFLMVFWEFSNSCGFLCCPLQSRAALTLPSKRLVNSKVFFTRKGILDLLI